MTFECVTCLDELGLADRAVNVASQTTTLLLANGVPLQALLEWRILVDVVDLLCVCGAEEEKTHRPR